MDLVYSGLVGRTVFFGIEHLGEARVFLEEREIFVVPRVISIFGAELDSDLQIFHRGVGFTRKAVESGESVVNVVGFGCRFSCLVEAFAGVIPTADIHHSDATLIVFFGGLGILLVAWLHALLGNLEVHASAVGKLFARAFENFQVRIWLWQTFAGERATKPRRRASVELERAGRPVRRHRVGAGAVELKVFFSMS